MSDVLTDVMVEKNQDGTFACTLMLMDYFEGDEHASAEDGPDVTIKLDDTGPEIVGESKITLNPQDLQNLATAIRQLKV